MIVCGAGAGEARAEARGEEGGDGGELERDDVT